MSVVNMSLFLPCVTLCFLRLSVMYSHTFYKYMYVFSYCIFVGGLCTVSSESLFIFISERRLCISADVI